MDEVLAFQARIAAGDFPLSQPSQPEDEEDGDRAGDDEAGDAEAGDDR